jgi:hypothetical protein
VSAETLCGTPATAIGPMSRSDDRRLAPIGLPDDGGGVYCETAGGRTDAPPSANNATSSEHAGATQRDACQSWTE